MSQMPCLQAARKLISQCGQAVLFAVAMPAKKNKTTKGQEEACCLDWLCFVFRKLKRIGSPISQAEYLR